MLRRLFAPSSIGALAVIALLALAGITAARAAVFYPHQNHIRLATTEIGYGDTGGVNCAVLRGTPFLCIKNQANAPVTDIQVVNMGNPFAPNSWISMGYFGGPIPPGGATVVKFGTYGSGCDKLLFVRLANGSSHPFNINVCQAASIVVAGW